MHTPRSYPARTGLLFHTSNYHARGIPTPPVVWTRGCLVIRPRLPTDSNPPVDKAAHKFAEKAFSLSPLPACTAHLDSRPDSVFFLFLPGQFSLGNRSAQEQCTAPHHMMHEATRISVSGCRTHCHGSPCSHRSSQLSKRECREKPEKRSQKTRT